MSRDYPVPDERPELTAAVDDKKGRLRVTETDAAGDCWIETGAVISAGDAQ